jgi:hypothetical protein
VFRLDVLRLFDDFLQALCDPEGGARFRALHAPSAVIRCGDGVRAAVAVEADDFAAAHRTISLAGHAALPVLRREALLEWSEDGSVAWFQVSEARGELSLPVAVGITSDAIGWCAVSPQVKRWSYRDGLLQSLSHYPWMRNGTPVTARALIDASFFRYYWRQPLTFQTLPDARFSCMMSTVCCRHDYEITLPPEAQMLIDAVPWDSVKPELVGTQLQVRADGKLQLKALNETCRFLGSQRQCLIHQTLGRQPFGPCSVFPFSFAHTPEGVSVAMSPICGASRRGIGVAPLHREEDLRERLVQSEARRTEAFRLAPGMEIPWESFRDIEKALCDLLAEPAIPPRRRLYLCTRLLGSLRDGAAIDTNQWLSEAPVPITGELREALRGMIGRVLAWDRSALKTLPPVIPPTLADMEVLEPAVVVRILQNTLFSKVYSYPFDLTTALNFVIVLYLVSLLMQAASLDGTLSDVMWQELGSLGVHGLLRFLLHEGVPDGFRATFGTAEFGQWLLVV